MGNKMIMVLVKKIFNGQSSNTDLQISLAFPEVLALIDQQIETWTR